MVRIRGFLEFVSADAVHDAVELAQELSRLAELEAVKAGNAGADVDAPREDYEPLYESLGARFPNLGLYTDPDHPDEEADALDDLTDIVIDLREVAWLWEHGDRAEAIWQLRFSLDHHLGEHLQVLREHLGDAGGESAE